MDLDKGMTIYLTWLDPDGDCPVQLKRFPGCRNRPTLPRNVPTPVTSEDAKLIANGAHADNIERTKSGAGPAYNIEKRAGGAGVSFADVELDVAIPWAPGHGPKQIEPEQALKPKSAPSK